MPNTQEAVSTTEFNLIVGVYVNRTTTFDLNADTGILAFVLMAKRRMDLHIRDSAMESTVTIDFSTASNHPYTLPDDYLETKELILNSTGTTPKDLKRGTLKDVRNKQGRDSGGEPLYYDTTGGVLNIGPAPRTTDTAEFVYYARPSEDLSDWDTSVYTKKFWNVLLAGTVKEYYDSLQDQEKSAYWEQQFLQRMEEAGILGNNEMYSGYAIGTKNA